MTKKTSGEAVTRLKFVTDSIHVHPIYVLVRSVPAALTCPATFYAQCQLDGGGGVEAGTNYMGPAVPDRGRSRQCCVCFDRVKFAKC